jgi:hypothetical protein
MRSVNPDVFVYVSFPVYNIVGIKYRRRICHKMSVSLFSTTSVGNPPPPFPTNI